jgi:UDP-N-acetylglucosamine--N-acetylmuramyl-(pentapeptide) pyrophosphoryl-undecaprenol N-acetylglucosamine transferase
LIAGGGTAGHVVPALALADVLRGRGHQIAFCGTERGMEKQLVARAGYPFHRVRIRGFERKLGLSTLRTCASLPVAAADACGLLRSYRPDCVVGVGAYVSGPLVAEAAVAGIPTVAIEMDAHMGWTNRILSTMVDRVCLSFPEGLRDSDKFVYTGRPLLPALLSAAREQGLARFGLSPDRPVVLVFGGSLGARTLNRATVEAFAHVRTRFQILHVTGEQGYGSVAAELERGDANPDYQAFPFLDELPLALAAADAVVARAGGSVAEILARGVPSLLVPYPHAAGDHQNKNAQKVAAEGAALTVADADLNAERLTAAVETLLDPDVNRRMREAALQLARPEATERIADIVVELVAARAEKDHD